MRLLCDQIISIEGLGNWQTERSDDSFRACLNSGFP